MKKTILIISAVAFIFSCKKEYITQEGDIINNTTVTENKSIEETLKSSNWIDTSYSNNVFWFFNSNNDLGYNGQIWGKWYISPDKSNLIIQYDTTNSQFITFKQFNTLPFHADSLSSMNVNTDYLKINYINYDDSFINLKSNVLGIDINLSKQII